MALDLLLIPRWGVLGAASAVTLVGILINTLRIIEVFVLLRIWPYDLSFLKPVTAGAIALAASYLVSQWLASVQTLLQVIAGGLTIWASYAGAIVALRLSDEDRLVLDRMWTRLNRMRSSN